MFEVAIEMFFVLTFNYVVNVAQCNGLRIMTSLLFKLIPNKP